MRRRRRRRRQEGPARERQRERNRKSGEVGGGDAGGYWRDDKGQKVGPLDPTKDGRYLRDREAFERQKAEKEANSGSWVWNGIQIAGSVTRQRCSRETQRLLWGQPGFRKSSILSEH
jgi:hypothetical protein